MGVTLTGTLHCMGSYGTSPSLEKTQPSYHSNRASTLPKFHHKPGACSGCQDPGVSADRGLHPALICKKLPHQQLLLKDYRIFYCPR